MAVTTALVTDRDVFKQVSLIATADADTTTAAQLWTTLLGTAFPVAPLIGLVTPVTAAGGLAAWAITAMTATGFTCVKSIAVGSGAAPVQALISFFLAPAFCVGTHPVQGRNPFALVI